MSLAFLCNACLALFTGNQTVIAINNVSHILVAQIIMLQQNGNRDNTANRRKQGIDNPDTCFALSRHIGSREAHSCDGKCSQRGNKGGIQFGDKTDQTERGTCIALSGDILTVFDAVRNTLYLCSCHTPTDKDYRTTILPRYSL